MKEEDISDSFHKIMQAIMAAMGSKDMLAIAELAHEQLTKQGIGLDIELTLNFGGRIKEGVSPIADFKIVSTQNYECGEACRFTYSRRPEQSSPKTKIFNKNVG